MDPKLDLPQPSAQEVAQTPVKRDFEEIKGEERDRVDARVAEFVKVWIDKLPIREPGREESVGYGIIRSYEKRSGTIVNQRQRRMEGGIIDPLRRRELDVGIKIRMSRPDPNNLAPLLFRKSSYSSFLGYDFEVTDPADPSRKLEYSRYTSEVSRIDATKTGETKPLEAFKQTLDFLETGSFSLKPAEPAPQASAPPTPSV